MWRTHKNESSKNHETGGEGSSGRGKDKTRPKIPRNDNKGVLKPRGVSSLSLSPSLSLSLFLKTKSWRVPNSKTSWEPSQEVNGLFLKYNNIVTLSLSLVSLSLSLSSLAASLLFSALLFLFPLKRNKRVLFPVDSTKVVVKFVNWYQRRESFGLWKTFLFHIWISRHEIVDWKSS